MAESLLAAEQTTTEDVTQTQDSSGSVNTGSPDAPTSFWDSVSDDIKNNPSVAPFQGKSPDEVLKAYVNTKQLVGADTVKKLSKHATNEDKVKFLKDTMGLPAELAEYEVKVPENMDLPEEALNKFKEAAFKNGMLPWQFESLLQEYNDYYSGQLNEMQTNMEARQKEELDTLKKEFGQAYDQNMMIARDALKTLADDRYDAVVQEMTERGWGNSPELARVLVAAGKLLFTEGEIKGKTKGQISMSPEEAQSEIAAIQGNPDHPYHIDTHPNHAKAVEEMQKLFKAVTPDEEA